MSCKSFHDLSRWGQMERLKKTIEKNEEITAVNTKGNVIQEICKIMVLILIKAALKLMKLEIVTL